MGGGALPLQRHPDHPSAPVRRRAGRPFLRQPGVGSRHRGGPAARAAPRRRVVSRQHAGAARRGRATARPRRRRLRPVTSAAERPANLYTIPPGVAFVDALAAELLAESGGEPLALARYTVLLPTRRSLRALQEALLRRSEGRPLLLPRLL